jgi:hypothetical protein
MVYLIIHLVRHINLYLKWASNVLKSLLNKAFGKLKVLLKYSQIIYQMYTDSVIQLKSCIEVSQISILSTKYFQFLPLINIIMFCVFSVLWIWPRYLCKTSEHYTAWCYIDLFILVKYCSNKAFKRHKLT